jgi:pimeloyl-ACP methyl ester carboxylesterase
MTVSTAARYKPARPKLSVRGKDPYGRETAAAMNGTLEKFRGEPFRHILFLVHGYNNDEAFAAKNYSSFFDILDSHLRRFPFDIDAIVDFHWPGNPAIDLGLLTPTIHYPYALLNAQRSAALLADFINKLPKPGPLPNSLKVSVVGHSMGCRLIMHALKTLAAPKMPELKCIGLMAAAVPVELVNRNGALFVSGEAGKNILKFFSTNDWVLRGMFPMGQKWSATFLDNGRPVESAYYREPVGLAGNPSGFAVPHPRPRNGHSDYWNDERVIQKILNFIDPRYAIPNDSHELSSNTLLRHRLAAYAINGLTSIL